MYAKDMSSVPLMQMLSGSHTLAYISQWLSTWKASMDPPNEVVIDDYAALIGAVVKVFASCSLMKAYIENCFN